ncbi:TPA: CTP synthase [Candidatus Dependentiae bacterium]|nr:MAG: CTP synthetase [candidate division TM6 bacterium GW2011_GWE2_36_25]KKQ18800.1 MAG: CTP synthetase [candidate division TM6 bacterium GW2011_GWA2_36_9]HBR70162.1 CTP synthase [Candidatus Dependentiae bacterium]HCU01056.1 CTP synthase [Candidatus Dependentiae bacterium]
MNKKFVFVVGGVMSSVGKGIAAASTAALLQARGFKVTNIKCDMYVNIDAGTIRPTEHGEVFVGVDGVEADQDLGNYERFTGQSMTAINYVTTGQVYQEVIRRERNLEYGGEDVEVVPDIPNEIIRRIYLAQEKAAADVTVIEFGGTVGEYQVLLFLEAARMMKLQHPDDVAFIMVSYLPYPKYLGEMKTKPTQFAVRTLNSAGIQADFIIARGEKELDEKRKKNLAYMCNLKEDHVISAPDLPSIYEVPLAFHVQNFDTKLLKTLGLTSQVSNFSAWEKLVHTIKHAQETVKIGILGKYFKTGDFTLADSYISVLEAVKHACWAHDCAVAFAWIDPEEFEENDKNLEELKKYDGVICPGGFGSRGVEGILKALKYIREKKIPFFGLCHGMQLACIEFARNVLGINKATSAEIDAESADQIIHINPHQLKNVQNKKYGGTMRLGSYDVALKKGSIVQQAYGTEKASERHRHRYEFNNVYRESMEAAGLKVVGLNKENDLVEIVELANHPFYVGTQFHPEFESTPFKPQPLFKEFINASSMNNKR